MYIHMYIYICIYEYIYIHVSLDGRGGEAHAVAQTTVIWCGDPRSSDSSPTQSLAVSRVPTAFSPPCVNECFAL